MSRRMMMAAAAISRRGVWGLTKKLWELTIFTNPVDPNLEADVQWVFIKALNIRDGRFTVTSERGKNYQVDIDTKAITPSDSLSSTSPGVIRDVPDAVKKALTSAPPGKNMTSLLASSRPIWKEILMATARCM